MKKLRLFLRTPYGLILSASVTISGFLSIQSSSMAIVEQGPEVIHRSCTQLQKSLNDRSNPDIEYKGFEKSVMGRRKLTIAGKYVIFCNGGIVTDRTDGTICRGYIGYSYSYVASRGVYYGDWGQVNGEPNFNDTDQGKYCRWIDRPR
jgi:hypothetical protein